MVPRWLPGSKKESFWVTLGCLLEIIWSVFCMISYTKCKVVFQGCSDFRSYFLIKDCRYYLFTCCFLMCFAFVYPYSVDVVEAAPLELLGHANTRSSFLLHLCPLI